MIMMKWVTILLLCLPAFGQATSKGAKYVGTANYILQGQGLTGTGENFYCPAGASELTEGVPTWGANDGLAQLPTRCMNTAMASTPGGTHIGGGAATSYTPTDATTLNAALSTLQCGDTIVLAAGTAYTGNFTMPAPACDGGHWIMIKSSGVSNPNFPAEGVRATPCIAGIVNDGINGRALLGYPDYPCASYPTVLSAKIMQGSSGPALSFTTGANHYRFIGLEITKNPANNVGQIINLAVDGLTMGANHIIFDRSLIHGDQWTPASSPSNESQNGINAKNSQWIAMINSWGYDTYCNSSCVDSHNYGAGTGFYQDGPHKLYNNLLATAGESFFFGGGGVGPGTPNTADVEIRSNHSFKPLTWMVPINTCANYYQTITKNLGELKNLTLSLIEGNFFENSWQGCQSDQNGTAFKWNPTNQNQHQSMHIDADGTNVVNSALQCNTGSNAGNSCTNDTQCPGSSCIRKSFTHNTTSSPLSGNPIDAANCPPGGCILDDIASNINYRFCDGVNSCDQSGIPNQQCGTTTPQGSVAGTACTTNAQCPGSYCAPTITTRVTQPVPAATFMNVNGCVPGQNPNAKNLDITFRFNEVYNATGGLGVNTGLDSICRDQSAGMKNISIHDNLIRGLSLEMSNGDDPYSDATAVSISNNSLPPSVVGFVGVRHNTFAVETGNSGGSGSFGNQVDHSDIQYMEGIAITDNVSPAAYGMSHGNGTGVTKGIGGAFGLANTYAVNSCQRYFTAEVPDGTVSQVTPPQDFTFAGLLGGGTNYLVSLNGQYTAITSQGPTGFHVTATVNTGDTIVVRDLNDCNWTFRSNLIGLGFSGISGVSPNFFGSGKDQSPYPNPNTCGAGNGQTCLLDESQTPGSFINNFVNWGTGRSGDFRIANGSPYFNTASDALTRPPSGKSPGADFVLLAATTAGVRGATFLPALTVTTSTLPGGTSGLAYNGRFQASFGASQYWDGYKGWFLETTASLCAGNCGSINNGAAHSGLVIGRSGIVNGPFAILNVSRAGCPAACVSSYTVTQTIVDIIPPATVAWEVGQVVSLANFLDCTTNCTANNTHDGSFNGVCTITALGTNGFSCRQSGDIAGTTVNTPSHNPYSPKTCGVNGSSFCDSTASFAPISAGAYTFWVGARDGAFQVARGAVTVVVGP